MKKIVFLSGTRADFGKIKSLIQILENHNEFEAHVFVTGMHLLEKYGKTIIEVEKCKFSNIYSFENHTDEATMDLTLAKTIEGFSKYIKEVNPDLVVVHGDRVEALAGAIVGSLNNILVAHIEGGEISGTIDELIRHSVSKLSHLHLVSNLDAKRRLLQMGELDSSVFVIGSPDLDLMNPKQLPDIDTVKKYYEILFDTYGVVMFHPVTTEFKTVKEDIKNVVTALITSNKNYVVIYPNNDLGTTEILEEFKRLENNLRFRIIPSLRFEYFLRLLKEADFIIGNSSAGVREAPYYNVTTINIGSRQNNRVQSESIINAPCSQEKIYKAIMDVELVKNVNNNNFEFGNGDSNNQFLKLLLSASFWEVNCQKQFQDLL
ncbi:MAG: UDP-N-acetylglucosamine 2-epimerase (hydrolyzing), partial [Polaribacter sp.]|jgi:UDP-N-acetylglucosamine 2-epimerase (hydrolysing)